MQITPISNTNFQANLNLINVDTHKARWKNIAKIFNEKTINNPQGKIIVQRLNIDTRLSIYPNIEKMGEDSTQFLVLNSTINEIFKKHSDKTIATYLAKFLK